MKNKGILVIIIIAVAAFLVYNAAYTVDETQQVIITHDTNFCITQCLLIPALYA